MLSRVAILTCWSLAAHGAGLPMLFIPNTGQVDARVRFVGGTPESRTAFLDDGVWIQSGAAHLRMRFVGGQAAQVVGIVPLEARTNFLVGGRERWRTDLETFGGIEYRALYPGIDARYLGSGRALKSEFLVAPGADPGLIRMDYGRDASVHLDPDGSLVVEAGGVRFREAAPEIYSGSREVPGRYILLGDGVVGFEIGNYDAALPLVIDPVITYSTYLGGSGTSAVTAVARDGLGNLYAAGWTESIDFPVSGAMQAVNRGGVDAFIVKLDPTGSSLLYATYIGGSGDDRAAGIAVDGSGFAIVVGATGSSNFPLQAPSRSTMVGGREAFALKLSANGSSLVYSTFLGGSNYDVATAVAIDGAGNAYVAGDTYSADFPVVNAVQSSFGGKVDAFVVKLNSSGGTTFSTFLGGALEEHAGGIAVDGSGNAFLAGGTLSTNFPVAGATQSANAGGQDAFVAKIKTTSATQLVYSTYLGGTGGSAATPEQANAIAIDTSGNAYVAGVTSSTNFPVTAGALQQNSGGGREAFIAKFNAAGTARLYSTYLGWTGFDWANGIAVDGSGNAYVAGYTSSIGFANIGGVQAGFNGLYDGFISKLTSSGNALSFSTLYGGSGSDQINAIAVDANGNMWIGGQTSSLNLPTLNAIQGTNISGNTGWVARLGLTPPPSQLPSADSVDVVYGQAGAATIAARFSHPAGASSITSAAVLLSRTASVDFACYITYNPATEELTLAGNIASGSGTTIPLGSSGAQNTQCQLTGSSRTTVGNSLTLTLSVILDAGFPGNTTVYLLAADANVNTGWVAKVGISQVSADSVSPSAGGGASQVFTFVFSDTKEASNVQAAAMLINSTLSGNNACWLVFDRARGTISLLYDHANGSNAKPFGSSANVQNSQCALGAPSMTVSGTSTILSIPLAFYGAFTGPKNVYMYAQGPNGNTGWVQKGTYSVVAGGVPVAQSVSPPAGSGASQAFSFTISDQGGQSFLWAAAMLFSRSTNFDLNNGCYVVWDRTTSRLALFADTYTSGSSSFTVGSSSSVSNSQCTLYGSGSSVSFGTTTITITLNLAFKPAFAGNKNSFLYASEPGYNSGWVLVGNWTVPGSPPALTSVTPNSGTGLNQTFTLTATTAVSPSDLTSATIRVAPSGGGSALCETVYNRTANTIGLYSDGDVLSTKPIGSSAALQNSQCAIGYSAASFSGNNAVVTVQIVFKSPAFAGAKNVAAAAQNAWGSSGFSVMGTWTVP